MNMDDKEGGGMRANGIRWGRALIAGLLATIVGFVIGFVLYGAMNGVYESYGDLPYAKQPESIPVYLLQMVAGGAVLNVLLAAVYAIIREGLPGQTAWQKGLAFGAVLLVVNMLPIAFNTWMQIAQPTGLILVEAVNRSIGLMVQAVIMAIVYGQRPQRVLA
jgi:MFS family permease